MKVGHGIKSSAIETVFRLALIAEVYARKGIGTAPKGVAASSGDLLCMRTNKHLYFGKYCEHRVISELLRRRLDVYVPIVDKGIDCIIRNKNGKHIDIQIKGRKPNRQFNTGKVVPRENYFFILIKRFSRSENIYIVPSRQLSLWLRGKSKVGLSLEKLREYKDAYDLLTGGFRNRHKVSYNKKV